MTGISNFYRGDTKSIKLTFVDGSGTPIDITGAIVYFTVKKSHYDPDDKAVIRKVITNHIDAANGITGFTIEYEDTANLKLGSYYFDIRIVFPGEQVTTVLNSTLKLLPEVTKDV